MNQPGGAPTSGPAARLQQAWTNRGVLATALWPLSLLLRLLVALRRLGYSLGLWRTRRLPVPVVVVGNLVAGGAGKTPTVLAVVALLQAQGHRPGIVSRGHGRAGDGVCEVRPDGHAGTTGDEPLLLRRRSGVPVWVGRDRVAAGAALLARHPDTTVLVSDDGLQHLALARDLQVVVFDERGAGNGWLLPAGPLREPLPAAVDRFTGGVASVVVYNAPRPTTALPGTLARTRLAGAVPLAAWHHGGPVQPLDQLPRRRWLAVAGTARPQRFFAMLRGAGIEFTECPLSDHHPYATLPWPPETAAVLTTEKDAVKLDPARLGATEAWVLPLDLALDPAVADALRRAVPPPFPTAPPSPTDGHPTA